ncbi:hypothetical protein [Polynucleobacter sp. AP-Nickl1-40-C4]|uniref:hypothetical protein n=1 Tax=Polynucleobacter sp. AP-Nickl1-40-C4 TaxID=3108275 RepID=UPI002B22D101|nr:hypothetical protein [Polynucleobacter sp. AP-Nickl1-40-C4]MEA9567534.1 hypothetical protein [Polynucleobacter sp. AP-Nickl1-40-C4]
MPTASAVSCDDLRIFFQQPKVDNAEISLKVNELEGLINQNDMCAKNLFGRLEYEGQYFPKNDSNAKRIFIDLSNQGYPPAMFNLAYIQAIDKSSNPEEVLGLLLGIYSSYVDSKDYGALARKSMEYGRSYIDTFGQPQRDKLSQSFERAISEANVAARDKVSERLRIANERGEALGAVLLAGMGFLLGARAASGLAARSATMTTAPQAAPFYTIVPSGTPGVFSVIPSR